MCLKSNMCTIQIQSSTLNSEWKTPEHQQSGSYTELNQAEDWKFLPGAC